MNCIGKIYEIEQPRMAKSATMNSASPKKSLGDSPSKFGKGLETELGLKGKKRVPWHGTKYILLITQKNIDPGFGDDGI